MVVTTGKDATLRYVLETTPGTTPTNPALQLFSKEVTSAVIGTDQNVQDSGDIGGVDVQGKFSAKTEYTIKAEGHVHDAQRILDFIPRNADGTLKSYAFEYVPDNSAAVKHYYAANGWSVKSLSLTTATGEAWDFSIEFFGGKIEDPVTAAPSIGTGSRETNVSITDAIKTFATAAVTLNGSAFAAVVGAFSIQIENDAEAHWTMGSKEPLTTIARGGTRKVSGSCDISLDDGAATAWARNKAFGTHTIVVPFGTTGAPQLTVTGAVFPTLEVESGEDTDMVMGGQDYEAAGQGCIAVGTVP